MGLGHCPCRRGGSPIEDWGDLLQPRLAGRIAWVDSPREFVGAALKTLGLGLNASAADLAAAGVSAADVRARVEQLRQQVPGPAHAPAEHAVLV